MYAVESDKKNHHPWDKKLRSKYILYKSTICLLCFNWKRDKNTNLKKLIFFNCHYFSIFLTSSFFSPTPSYLSVFACWPGALLRARTLPFPLWFGSDPTAKSWNIPVLTVSTLRLGSTRALSSASSLMALPSGQSCPSPMPSYCHMCLSDQSYRAFWRRWAGRSTVRNRM